MNNRLTEHLRSHRRKGDLLLETVDRVDHRQYLSDHSHPLPWIQSTTDSTCRTLHIRCHGYSQRQTVLVGPFTSVALDTVNDRQYLSDPSYPLPWIQSTTDGTCRTLHIRCCGYSQRQTVLVGPFTSVAVDTVNDRQYLSDPSYQLLWIQSTTDSNCRTLHIRCRGYSQRQTVLVGPFTSVAVDTVNDRQYLSDPSHPLLWIQSTADGTCRTLHIRCRGYSQPQTVLVGPFTSVAVDTVNDRQYLSNPSYPLPWIQSTTDGTCRSLHIRCRGYSQRQTVLVGSFISVAVDTVNHRRYLSDIRCRGYSQRQTVLVGPFTSVAVDTVNHRPYLSDPSYPLPWIQSTTDGTCLTLPIRCRGYSQRQTVLVGPFTSVAVDTVNHRPYLSDPSYPLPWIQSTTDSTCRTLHIRCHGYSQRQTVLVGPFISVAVDTVNHRPYLSDPSYPLAWIQSITDRTCRTIYAT